MCTISLHLQCNRLTKVQNADGFIDLTRVKYVRTVKRKPEGEDAGVGRGESVDFHAAELSTNDSEYAFEQGVASEFDDERTFELVLENALVIRLQSFNLETRREWMRRLRDLIKYWKLRLKEDMQSLKSMRAENLKMIKIDGGNESRFADWIQPYQLVEAISAPGMYHFCRLSNCRTISVASTCKVSLILDARILVRKIPSPSNFPYLYGCLDIENIDRLRTYESLNKRHCSTSNSLQEAPNHRSTVLLCL